MPNALYSLIRVSSALQSDGRGLSVLPIGPPVRHAGGIRLSALGLAAEHGAATFAFNEVAAVPLSIAVSQRNIPNSDDRLEIVCWMRHQGRSVLVTGMEAFRAGEHRDRVAFGTITWSVTSPPHRRPDPGPPESDGGVATGDLLGVAGVIRDGQRCLIESIRPQVAGPGGVLHAGALQTLAEESALDAARELDGPAAFHRVSDATFHFVRAARQGPFVARPRVVDGSAAARDVEIEVIDAGGDGRVCVICTARVVIAP